MGDPLSIAASIAGLTSTGIQVCQGLVDYYQSYKDRDTNVMKTSRSLESLSTSLQNIQRIIDGRRFSPEDASMVQHTLDIMGACRGAIDEVRI